MSNNKTNSKTKLTVMVAAIASVLLAGIGMNSAAYASIMGDRLPGFSIDDIGQSAECVGVLVECRENSDNIKIKDGRDGHGGNGGNGDQCESCIATNLNVDERRALSIALGEPAPGTASPAQICDLIGSEGPVALYNALVEIEISKVVIEEIFECLGLDIPVINT